MYWPQRALGSGGCAMCVQTGYSGDKSLSALVGISNRTIEIIKRSKKVKGTAVLPINGVVE